jgi:hypothetical protein
MWVPDGGSQKVGTEVGGRNIRAAGGGKTTARIRHTSIASGVLERVIPSGRSAWSGHTH